MRLPGKFKFTKLRGGVYRVDILRDGKLFGAMTDVIVAWGESRLVSIIPGKVTSREAGKQ